MKQSKVKSFDIKVIKYLGLRKNICMQTQHIWKFNFLMLITSTSMYRTIYHYAIEVYDFDSTHLHALTTQLYQLNKNTF